MILGAKEPGIPMQFSSLDQFLSKAGALLAKGPVAMIFIEDEVEIDTTLRHHIDAGFREILALMPPAFALPNDVARRVHRINFDIVAGDDFTKAVNAVIAKAPGTWLYYCFNAEYLFFPFCETRSIREMVTFHTEERRDAILTYVIDLYTGDLDAHPNAVCLEDAHVDKSGYYALARPDANGHPRERQLDFFGGLRWRYEEHVPAPKRNIDRIALFRAKPELMLDANHRFNDEEYNTYACPWHHNLTAAIVSFRPAKALKRNPGSTFDIETFKWHNSTSFEWHSRQLLDLGLMEPGQWF